MEPKDDNLFEWKCAIKAAVSLAAIILCLIDPSSAPISQIHRIRMELSTSTCPFLKPSPLKRPRYGSKSSTAVCT